jgi:hypothetical protein
MNKFDFKSGDIIIWCGECYKVIENWGYYGKVQQGSLEVFPFYWEYQGESSRLATEEDILMEMFKYREFISMEDMIKDLNNRIAFLPVKNGDKIIELGEPDYSWLPKKEE